MKCFSCNAGVALIFLVLSAYTPQVYAAQERSLPEKTEINVSLHVNGYHYNNADYTAYNAGMYEANKAVASENTDDAINFIFSTLTLGMHTTYKRTEFDLVADRSGFWGSDNLMGKDEGNNPVRFLSLHCIVRPFTFYSLRIGRFTYATGKAIKDYFFSDIVDGIEHTISIPVWISVLEIVAISDLLSNAAKPDDTYAWAALEKDQETIDEFKGDTLSTRHGVTLHYAGVSLFSYYVRYGANTEGAADISEDGKSSLNEADHDYLSMSGMRFLLGNTENVYMDTAAAYSIGADYQYDGVKQYNGYGAAVNMVVGMEEGPFDIPLLDECSVSAGYFSPGFCGMKADSPGGLLTYLYKGYVVAPYAYFYHFKDYTKDENEVSAVDKTVSKTFVRNDLVIRFGGVVTELAHIVFFAHEDSDSAVSNIAGKETKGKDTLQYMGTEINAALSYRIDQVELYVEGGVYMPSSYYTRKSRVNTFFTEGKEYMYGINAGCTYTAGF